MKDEVRRAKTNAAFDLVLGEIELIKESGIEVNVKDDSTPLSKELKDEYSGAERVSPKKWKHVSFYTKNKTETDKVYSVARSLFSKGISFDTGCGCGGVMDWELDWSFSFNKAN